MLLLLIGQFISGPGEALTFLNSIVSYSGESYVVIRHRRYDGRTTIKIQGPRGRRVIITNSRGRVIERGYTPMTVFVGLTGRYTIDVEGIGEITLYVKKGMDNILKITTSSDGYFEEEEIPERDCEVDEGRDYLIIREPYYRTLLEVRRPRGYRVELRKGERLIRAGMTPVKWSISGSGYYRVILRQGPMVVWSGRVRIWRDYRNRLYIWPPIKKKRIEPMSEEKFLQLIDMLKKAPFESDRMDIVRTAAKDNFFTSEQVRKIMETFQFDENRIRVARILYPRVVDRENFFVVYSALDHSSSREELRKWIDNQEESGYDHDEEEDWSNEWEEGWD